VVAPFDPNVPSNIEILRDQISKDHSTN
jgi:hypothetical protein